MDVGRCSIFSGICHRWRCGGVYVYVYVFVHVYVYVYVNVCIYSGARGIECVAVYYCSVLWCVVAVHCSA